MAQESVLRVGVDSRGMVQGAKKGERALNQLGQKAKQTETRLDSLKGSVGGLKAAFAAVGVGLVVREFAKLLDSATNIDNRLRLVTDSTARLNDVYGELFKIAQNTRTPLEVNAQLFNKFAVAGREMGKSYREVLDVVDRVNKTLQISGASSAGAAGALAQLGQALSAGALRGEEFNSVVDVIPRFMQAIADELKVPRSALRKLAEDGKITAEVIFSALKNSAEAIDEEFASITPTIASAFTVLSNAATNFVRDLNSASGIGEIIARSIILIADNFNIVAAAAAGLAIVIGGALVKSVIALTIALAANPIGLLVTVIAGLVTLIGIFGDKTVEVGGKVVTVWQVIKAAFVTAYDIFAGFVMGAIELFGGWLQATEDFFNETKRGLDDYLGDWGSSLDSVSGWVKAAVNLWIGLTVGGIKGMIKSLAALPAAWQGVINSVQNVVVTGMENVVNSHVEALATIGDALDFFSGGSLGESIRGLKVDLSDLKAEGEGVGDVLARVGEDIASGLVSDVTRDYIGDLTTGISELGGPVMEKFNANLESVIKNTETSTNLHDLLRRATDSVTDATKKGTGASKGKTEAQKAEEKALKELMAARKDFIEDLNDEYEQYRINNGEAVAVVNEWFEKQKMILTDLGFKYEDFATKLEAIYGERLAGAYQTDLSNASDWRSGIERALSGFGGGIKTEADLAEAAMTSLFSNSLNALQEFASTGKLDFKEFARSLAQDILMLTAKFLILTAVKRAFGGFSDGGAVGGAGNGIAALASMATGGPVRGPGSSTSDSIPAMLSDGEYVINAKATEQFRPLLDAINAGNAPSMFAAGGMVTQQPANDAFMPKEKESVGADDKAASDGDVQIVNLFDESTFSRWAESTQGKRTILNIVRDS